MKALGGGYHYFSFFTYEKNERIIVFQACGERGQKNET